jgi:hypothetical protein
MEVGHGSHEGPPQSTPVSAPFFVASSHVGAAQAFRWHTSVVQSVFAAHAAPGKHGEQTPPQSTSVSEPFFQPSLHEGAAHAPLEHTRLTQS